MLVDVLCLFTNLICVQKQTSRTPLANLRTPLANVDPNACQRLRSGLTTTKAALARLVKRSRGRPLTLFRLIKPLKQRVSKAPRPPCLQGYLQGCLRLYLTIDEQSVKDVCSQGCLMILTIYEDLVLDYETPLQLTS